MSVSPEENWGDRKSCIQQRIEARGGMPGVFRYLASTDIGAMLDGGEEQMQYIIDVLTGRNMDECRKVSQEFDAVQLEMLTWLYEQYEPWQAPAEEKVQELVQLFAITAHGAVVQIKSGADREATIRLVADLWYGEFLERKRRY